MVAISAEGIPIVMLLSRISMALTVRSKWIERKKTQDILNVLRFYFFQQLPDGCSLFRRNVHLIAFFDAKRFIERR